MGSVTVFKVVEPHETLNGVKTKLDRLANSPPQFKTVSGAQGEDVRLATTVTNVSGRPLDGRDAVSGWFKYEDQHETEDIAGIRHTHVKVYTAQFVFIPDPLRLLVFKGNAPARVVAARMSRLIYNQSDDPILSCRILPYRLDEFANTQASELKASALVNMSTPGITKARFAGPDVNTNPNYQRCNEHGEKDSIRVYLNQHDMQIAISSAASIQFFKRNLEIDDQLTLLYRYVLDLCT